MLFSNVYDGERHLVMDFDLSLKGNEVGINIINGKKRSEFQYPNVVAEIGEFLNNLRLQYETYIISIAWCLLVVICIAIVSMPWLVCSEYFMNESMMNHKDLYIEIVVGISIILVLLSVGVVFCCNKWLIKMRERNFGGKLQQFLDKTLSVKYPCYAYSIIHPKKGENTWCQLRISDHVLKCRADDEILHTTYNERTSLSIRNQSITNTHSPMKSPLLQ